MASNNRPNKNTINNGIVSKTSLMSKEIARSMGFKGDGCGE
jgi:hypothetical protein